MEVKVLVYGTRTSKDKSGAYLFLPDSEAKVADAPEPAGPGGRGEPAGPGGRGRAWEGLGGPGRTRQDPASLQCSLLPASRPAVLAHCRVEVGGWAVVSTVAQACWAQVVRPGHWAKDFGGPTLGWYCYCVLCAVSSVAFALFPALRPQEAPRAPSHRRPVLLGGGCILRALSPSGSPLQPAR